MRACPLFRSRYPRRTSQPRMTFWVVGCLILASSVITGNAAEMTQQPGSLSASSSTICFQQPASVWAFGVLLSLSCLLFVYLARKLRLERMAHLNLRNEVAENERHFRFIAENSADVIWTMDLASRRLTYISPSIQALRGFTPDEMMRQTMADWMTPDSATRIESALNDAIRRWNGGDHQDTKRIIAIEQPHKDGHLLHTEVVTTLHANDQGELVSILGVTRDISERKATEEMMHNLAFYDALTQLPNRRLLHDRLLQAIMAANRDHHKMALLFIDLDHFKPINDQHGHQTGDWLLKMVARRMLNCVRESDTVARMGGDEFVVLLPGPIDKAQVLPIAEKIHARLNQSFETSDGTLLQIACCIGIAFYPEHGKTPKQLLKHGDQAMYQAKENGRNQIQLFTSTLGHPEQERLTDTSHQLIQLNWKNDYASGISELDTEHRQLFQLANELLNTALEPEHSLDSIEHSLESLLQHITEHFDHEESLLAAVGYPQLAAHRTEHQQLLRQAAILHEAAALNELPFAKLLEYVVQEVILNHMLKHDRMYFSYLNDNQGMSEPAC
jgi:diguanylate cyclase (GGDEF)-like protein/hemerythrin-like metal-binding protein/PAS domain S-box-containing protein